jgi:hypothetical protein
MQRALSEAQAESSNQCSRDNKQGMVKTAAPGSQIRKKILPDVLSIAKTFCNPFLVP